MPPMMTGSSFGACLRINASSAAMSGRRLSSTAAMYSAEVFTFSCPFIASSEARGAGSPAPEDEVGDSAGARHGVEVEAVEQLVVGVPEAFAAADLDRRDGDVHRVDEVGVEERPDGSHTATEAYVLPVCGMLRLPQGFGGCGVEEV